MTILMNQMKRSTQVLLLLIVPTLCLSSLILPEETSNNASINDTIVQRDGMITIPLIPHSVQRSRNLNLARRLEKENRDAGYPARRRPRILQDESEHYSSQQVAALFQGYGTHYADLWCGTPPQRQTVIVDTGSGVTAFPCGECRDCGVPDYHIDPLYNEADSSTFTKLTCNDCLRGSCSRNTNECTIGQAYQEGSSWNAYEAMDSCYVGGFHNKPVDLPAVNDNDDLNPFDAKLFAFDMKFGCQTRLTGLFKTQLADGIMGMDVAKPSYWWQMYDAKKIAHKSFSLCFSRKDEADPSGTEAGAMSLGGTDTRLHKSEMVYTATQDGGQSGFYVVHIKKVWLREPDGGDSALSSKSDLKLTIVDLSENDLNGGRVIVDSGTTDTYFSKKFGVAFQAAWKEVMGESYSHKPLAMTAEELRRTQPTILFQLNGDVNLNKAIKERSKDAVTVGLANDIDADNPYDVILAIPPSHYYEYDDEEQAYVSRFYVDDNSGGVLGANAMMGHDVYFDVDRNRIGWAESDCDYTSMLAEYTKGQSLPNPPPQEAHTNYEKEPDTSGNDNIEEKATVGGNSPLSEGVCSGMSCQAFLTFAVLSSVLFVTWRLVRKPAGPNYDLADGIELELADGGGRFDDEAYVNGSRGPKYRDAKLPALE